MGEVYRAEDTKLGREVAIKVLPEAVANDPERLARFEREAKVLAALNHPNIAGIYSLESAQAGTEAPLPEAGHYRDGAADGTGVDRRDAESTVNFLVMELVEGNDLSELIARGPLPIDETLPIARQITDALEAAHERGIVHRDLKPANIKIDRDGQVKVLDFGLAKALDPSAGTETGRFSSGDNEGGVSSPPLSMSPTLTQQMTQAGVILGTAAYMSPEQAKGKIVDKRADIWAFGVVLFEMLVGRKLFEAESVPETLGAIFQQEIDLDKLPAATPHRLRRLLNRCLDRDPKSRLRDIGEARLAIQAVLDGDNSAPEEAPPQALRRSSALLVAATLIAGLLLGSLLTWLSRPRVDRQILKLEIPTNDLVGTRVQHPLISPDGRKVLFPEANELVIRSLDAMSSRSIPNSAAARFFCWSPDSESIAYVVGIKILKVSVHGGTPTPVANLPADVGGSGGMVWTQDDHLLMAGGDRTGIIQVSVQGGEFEEIASLDRETEVDIHEISLLPNKQDVVYTLHRKDPNGRERVVDTIGALKDGERREVLRLDGESIISVAYSPPGFLLYHQSTGTPGVWAVPFSSSEAKVTGDPFLVAAESWLPSASDQGTLLIVQGMVESLSEIVEVDREGRVLRQIAQLQSEGETPHLSPDNTRLAVSAAESSNWDIWIYDLERATRSRLTFDTTFEAGGRWSPDGDEILYSAVDMRQLKIRRVDGTGEARVVGRGVAADWIPDSSGFVFEYFSDSSASWNISFRLFDEDEARPLLETTANENSPRLSPDGRYLLYVSDETGRSEVLAQSFPAGEKRWQVSTDGGIQPQWSPTGLEIFYVEGATLMTVEVADLEAFTLGRPTPLLEARVALSYFDPNRNNSYTPGPNGRSIFLARAIRGADTASRLMLIQNWYEEFSVPD